MEQINNIGLEGCNDDEFYCPMKVDLENPGLSAASKCIPASWRCDKQTDCDGGEDEQGCKYILHSIRVRLHCITCRIYS